MINKKVVALGTDFRRDCHVANPNIVGKSRIRRGGIELACSGRSEKKIIIVNARSVTPVSRRLCR